LSILLNFLLGNFDNITMAQFGREFGTFLLARLHWEACSRTCNLGNN
jgi:hypothetical protein